jgi:DNA invertase Pin-like site-specific DNA recombinase
VARAPRAALYARVSTKDQDPELQLDELRQVARQRGWTVIQTYTDHGVSGAKAKRPALDQLMVDARKGKLDVVAVWRFDRFARSTSHLLRALEEFRALNVHFISTQESIDTSTPMGRMVFTMVSAVAELEREIIRERVQAGVDRAKAAGTHCGRPVVEIDLRPALAMFEQGYGLKATAKSLGVAVTTLRERLKEAGEWPRPQGCGKSPSA